MAQPPPQKTKSQNTATKNLKNTLRDPIFHEDHTQFICIVLNQEREEKGATLQTSLSLTKVESWN
jgi:hypothetical protein